MITVPAGRSSEEITVERRVDTVIIRQGSNVVMLDEYYVLGLREALALGRRRDHL